MSSVFIKHRGSDLHVEFQWPGAPDLTGWTLAGFEVHPSLAPFLTTEIVAPLTGMVSLNIQWGSFPQGRLLLPFRLALSKAGEPDVSTNQLWIEYT